MLTWGVIGATLGTGIYLYKEGYLKDYLPDIGLGGNGDGDGEPEPEPCVQNALCITGYTWDNTLCKCVKTPATPPPGSNGTYTYWAKRKVQCRDNHLTFNYIASQNIHVLNWKLYNDGKIYVAQCGAPGPLTILVAIDAQDSSSATKLKSLGFIQYFAPPTDPNPSVPIPNPPDNTSNVAMTLSYVGQSPSHRAYKVNTHVRRY